jgi:hypothetical protein
MGYDSKGILVFNLKYEHAISFINLVKFIYQMSRSISSKLFVIASGGGEANVYGSSYYWNFRTSSFKQVACLILTYIVLLSIECAFIKIVRPTDQTGKNFYHVTQFHLITVNHICFRYISGHIDNKKSI